MVNRLAGILKLSACAGAFILCVSHHALGADSSSTIIQPGTSAPSFSLPSLSGKRETMSVWCGARLTKPYINSVPHIVVLSFWATYCKPCQKEIPLLMKFAESHSEENIKIFCVSLDKEGASVVAPFVKSKGYTLPMLLDPYKRTAERYGVRTLPALIVIGPDGVVRFSSTGYSEETPFETMLEDAMDAAKKGKNMNVRQATGESIDVQPDSTDMIKPEEITPRQRWQAVARVECGESLEDVADDLGVPDSTIKDWYSQLKKAAIDLWKSEDEK